MTYFIIDESGDLGKHGSKYFIILGILIKNEKELERIIKNLRRNKFKKKLANIREIKGVDCSSALIKQILRKVNNLNVETYCIILDKDKFPIENKNNVYDYLAGLLAEQIELNSPLIVRIDKSKINNKDIGKFNELFREKLNIGNKLKVEIYHSLSHKYKSIQVVDVLAWSYFQKFERNNPEFVDLIHSKNKCEKVIKNTNKIIIKSPKNYF